MDCGDKTMKEEKIPNAEETCREARRMILKLINGNVDYSDREYTDGYIGNIEKWGDDRTFYIFQKPNPENSLQHSTSYGGYETKDSHRLLINAIEILTLKLITEKVRNGVVYESSKNKS
jgi:hypothetical protein